MLLVIQKGAMNTMTEILWQYFLIFIMAATPWLEILIVIPIGIGMGLHPFWVGFFSFIGNFLPIIIIVYSLKWLQQTDWYKRWKEKKTKRKQLKECEKTKKNTAWDDMSEQQITLSNKTKNKRAISIFNKYGLPGLALLGPVITGIHLAALIALALKSDKHETTLWLGGSLFAWTIFLTIASFYSIDWVTGLFS